MARILLIEDDPAVREAVELGLSRRSHEVWAVATGEAGLAALDEYRPDLLLLDLVLPGLNGIQVCNRVRETSQVPIVILSGRDDDFDIITALETGADDYLVKPTRAAILDARIRAVLRRTESTGAGPARTAEVHGDLTIDRAALTVAKAGRPMDLHPSGLRLLLHLAASPEQVFSRHQLLEHVWGHGHHTDTRLVDACVARLRQRIEDPARRPRYLQTVRGFGYRFGPL
ncbi:response regulator transcription factor [Streptomyces sp. NPDC056519]|uniref:response regulator transcription factor n=1 Tax=Streptomyces sp. NPDC056519 TaxID=3345849 RepID=UPI00367C75B1